MCSLLCDDITESHIFYTYYPHNNRHDGDKLSQVVGFKWDSVVNNGSAPSNFVVLSQSLVTPTPADMDVDLTAGTNTQVSNAFRYTAISRANVFSTGFARVGVGVDSDRLSPSKEDTRVKQITVNLLASMGDLPLNPIWDIQPP